jgi:hypothetical protein
VLQAMRHEIGGAVIMVGDGITDLETSGVADLFVAYAGVVMRAAVVAGADVVIRSPSMAPMLPLALGGEPPRAAGARELYDRGLSLLEQEYRAFVEHSQQSPPNDKANGDE